MPWQLTAVILIVAVASCYLLRQTWRAWTGAGKAGCGGCARAPKPSALIPPEQLTLRRRDPDQP